jgi:ZIP family zinc transporter
LDLLIPFLLSLIAGSASGIGGLIVLLMGEVNERILGFLMGFAGGVMLVISFLELFVESLSILSHLDATFAFTVGAVIMMVVDLTIPHMEAGRWEDGIANPRMLKTGLIIGIGISIHNFPEGIAISAGFTHMPRLGLLIAIMICLHNIPEGIATATPLIAAGVSRRKAAWIALLSGITEPIGALVGVFLINFFGGSNIIIGWGLGLAAGVMTYITVDELIPVAHEYCSTVNKHLISIGLLSGMIFGHLLSVALQV